MADRLQKVMAARGVTSRRKAEELIAAGRVTVNGVAAHLGQQVEEDDSIALDGRPVESPERLVYIALHKPRGVISAVTSAHGDTSVVELVQVPERIYPVGRLDKDSSGLLLLTNDGDWANLVTHPRYGTEKEYEVLVEGVPNDAALSRLRSGIELPDGTTTGPARVERLRAGYRLSRFSVTVVEGKKRQIRLMFAAVGHPVTELIRVRIGPIALAGLPVAHWRRLDAEEVMGVRKHAAGPARTSTSGVSSRSHRRSGLRR